MYLGATAVDSDTARDTELVRQMHALAQQIYYAKQRQDVEEVQRLLAQFKVLADEYRERGPIGVNAFDKFVLATGEWVAQAMRALPNAIAALPFAVGSGLIKGLLPFALIAAGVLYFKGKL